MWCQTLNPSPWEAKTGRFEASYLYSQSHASQRNIKRLSQNSFLKIKSNNGPERWLEHGVGLGEDNLDHSIYGSIIALLRMKQNGLHK